MKTITEVLSNHGILPHYIASNSSEKSIFKKLYELTILNQNDLDEIRLKVVLTIWKLADELGMRDRKNIKGKTIDD